MNVATLSRLPAAAQTGGGRVVGQVERALRRAIMALELAPGQRLSEQDLAERLGVSRQPVREALIVLAGAGLVAVQPQRGTFVTKLSATRMREARFVREAVEVAVVRQACAGLPAATRFDLDERLRRQDRAAAAGDHMEFAAEDEAFHAALAHGAGCALAWDAVRLVKTHMDRVCTLSLSDGAAMLALVRQHAAILDAVDTGHADDAAAAMSLHLTQLLDSLPRLQRDHAALFDK